MTLRFLFLLIGSLLGLSLANHLGYSGGLLNLTMVIFAAATYALGLCFYEMDR